MRNLFQLFAITALVIANAACTRSVNNPSPAPTPMEGNFKITLLTDNSSGDITTDFAAYTFQFNPDGKIIATTGSSSENGTFTETASHEGEGAKFEIKFNTSPLNKLNKKWQIEAKTSDTIHLKDDNSVSIERLHFAKI